ncbi:MAG: type II toxin-antitoxin system HicA family toxin [Candidatus Omnitrophota bacterium]
MTKIPSLSFIQIIRILQKAGWIVVRQKGSHIRLQKRFDSETIKITVPAHNPVKRSTLSQILKQARLDLDFFLQLQ